MEVVNLCWPEKTGYEAINRLSKVRDDLMMAGLRHRGRSHAAGHSRSPEDREQSGVLASGFSPAETDTILNFEEQTDASAKELMAGS
jgi:hypothetical protein